MAEVLDAGASDRSEVSLCRVACATQDHASWGECVRAARIGTGKGETTRGTV